MTAEQLLSEIADYCRRVGMAESTFGRRAVNDGKLVSRLRIGGRVTMETVERVRTFMSEHRSIETRGLVRLRSSAGSLTDAGGVVPDHFFEHPATVLVMTNLYYSEAPWLTPKSVTAATSLVWKEVALTGATSSEFEQQITNLQPFLNEQWRASVSKTSGNPAYAKPVVLVFYREDQKFLLDQVLPRRGAARADYDLVIASQPYRARASAEFKASKVLAPLAS